MKTTLFTLTFTLLYVVAIAQSEGTSDDVENIWRQKTSFVIGGGPGIFIGKIYDQPFADRIGGNVHISNYNLINKLRANLSFGISYTFTTKTFITNDLIVELDGKIRNVQGKVDKPHGISALLLVNPITLTNDSFNASSSVNIGVGLGYKWGGGFAAYAVLDFVGLRQPRQSFIDIYGNTNQPYKINDDIQYAFDIKDENIFKTQIYPVVGLKLVYSIEIFSSFKALARSIENQQSESRLQNDLDKKNKEKALD